MTKCQPFACKTCSSCKHKHTCKLLHPQTCQVDGTAENGDVATCRINCQAKRMQIWWHTNYTHIFLYTAFISEATKLIAVSVARLQSCCTLLVLVLELYLSTFFRYWYLYLHAKYWYLYLKVRYWYLYWYLDHWYWYLYLYLSLMYW